MGYKSKNVIRCLFLFGVLSLFFSSCSALKDMSHLKQITAEPNHDFDDLYASAINKRILGDYTSAFDLLNQCEKVNSKSPEVAFELAQVYAMLNEKDRVHDYLLKAATLAPRNYWFQQALANLYIQENNMSEATKLYENIVISFPSKDSSLMTLLRIYNQQKKYDDVIRVLNIMEKLNGKDEQLSMQKFRTYFQLDKQKEAFDELQQLIDEYPEELRYRTVLGDAFLQNGESQKAFKTYQNVLKKDPENPYAIFSLANYYQIKEDSIKYRKYLDLLLLNSRVSSDIKANVLRQLIVNNPDVKEVIKIKKTFELVMDQDTEDVQIPMLYVAYLISIKDQQSAIPVLYEILTREPTNKLSRLQLISFLIQGQTVDELIDVCEGGILANPDALEFYFYAAIGYNQKENYSQTLKVAKLAAEKVTPDTKKELASQIYGLLGDAYHEAKNYDASFSAYDKALEYNPSDITVLNNYAYFLSVLKRNLSKAEEMSYKTIKAHPNEPTFLDTYAWILFEQQKYAQAKIYIDQAIKNGGSERFSLLEHSGDIYFMNGKHKEALLFWKKSLKLGNTSQNLKKKIKLKKYIKE